MVKSIKIAPPHPQLYILDAEGGDIPEWEDKPILATASCIMFRCLPSIDGETEVTLGLAAHLDPTGSVDFDGHIQTPSKEVVIETSESDRVLSQMVQGDVTRVRIWLNDALLADEVIVALG